MMCLKEEGLGHKTALSHLFHVYKLAGYLATRSTFGHSVVSKVIVSPL